MIGRLFIIFCSFLDISKVCFHVPPTTTASHPSRGSVVRAPICGVTGEANSHRPPASCRTPPTSPRFVHFYRGRCRAECFTRAFPFDKPPRRRQPGVVSPAGRCSFFFPFFWGRRNRHRADTAGKRARPCVRLRFRSVAGGDVATFGHGRRSSCAKIRPAPTSFTSAGVVTPCRIYMQFLLIVLLCVAVEGTPRRRRHLCDSAYRNNRSPDAHSGFQKQ